MDAPTVLLGTIALATVVMAVVQVGIFVYGARLAQRVNRLVDQVEKEIQPALNRVNSMSGDANRVTALAVAQLERVDQLFGQFASRADQIMALAQDALVAPVRQGAALVEGMRAALVTLWGDRHRTPAATGEPTGEDDEALFIG